MATPEQAIAALAAYFATNLASTFPTQSRRVQFWDQTAQQPALFIRHENDEDTWSGGGLVRSIVKCTLWIYARPGASEIPDTVLNALVQAIADSFAADDYSNEFTLGGLVSWVRIEGTTEFYPGDIAQQAIAIIPISMLLNCGTVAAASNLFTLDQSQLDGPDVLG